MLADLGEAGTMRAWKGIQSVIQRKSLKGSIKVKRTQIWVDLIKEGADREIGWKVK